MAKKKPKRRKSKRQLLRQPTMPLKESVSTSPPKIETTKKVYNYPRALADIVEMLFVRGHFPGLLVFILLMVAICRMPSNDIKETVTSLFTDSIGAILGWILCFVTVVVAGFVARFMHIIHTKEIDRIAKERDWFKQQLGLRIRSSDD